MGRSQAIASTQNMYGCFMTQPQTFFITGTDTEVGKTYCTCLLLQAMARAGWRCAGYKPVASGSMHTAAGWRNDDVLALQAAASVALPYDVVNRVTLAEATAPHLAARSEQRPILLNELDEGLAAVQARADWVLVEGAGGWHTPLTEEQLFSDWVRARQLPVILVVGLKLGAINHALLTAQAVAQAGLPLWGWIANEVIPAAPRQADYLASLQARLPAPCLAYIRHGADVAEMATALALFRQPEWVDSANQA